jgi:DNA processing protein
MVEAQAKSSLLSPAQLIALNTTSDLSRAAVCQLAWSSRSWWPRRRAATMEASKIGVSPSALETAQTVLSRAAEIAAAERSRAEACGVRIITSHEVEYPAALFDLALPPPVLYLRGTLPERPCLSIVGARHATPYGLEVAGAFASHLAERGLVIASGFARGVDAAAHRAAAAAEGGATVAVLGCGVDVDYPRGRRKLRHQLVEGGALVSEFPLGTRPLPQYFPIRNRLIAALGHGTLVVEATAKSGSLITARLALELGRDIYAVPGRIFDPKALGPNTLIRDGAFLVQHPDDILITLPQPVHDALPQPVAADSKPLPARLPREQQVVLAALDDGGQVGVEELGRRARLPVTELLSALLELEIGGWVRRRPGPSYVRAELW